MGYQNDDDGFSFDYDNFSSQFDLSNGSLGIEEQPRQRRRDGWNLSTDGRVDEVVIYGDSPEEQYTGEGFNSRPTGDDSQGQRTIESEKRGERERIARARLANGNISDESSTVDDRGNGQGWIDEQNTIALREAIRRIGNTERQVHFDGEHIDFLGDTGRRIVKDVRDLVPIRAPKTFLGCEFEATLSRLYLSVGGEWVVAFKVKYEDGRKVRELDVTTQMALSVKVEQI